MYIMIQSLIHGVLIWINLMGPVCYVDVPVTVQHHVRVFFESKEAVLLDA